MRIGRIEDIDSFAKEYGLRRSTNKKNKDVNFVNANVTKVQRETLTAEKLKEGADKLQKLVEGAKNTTTKYY